MRRVALLLVLATCSGSPKPTTHRVAIRAMTYEPALVDVAIGDTVVWTNMDVVPHTVTSTSRSAARFDSASLVQNAQWSYVVSAPGELTYTCTFHPTMFGSVVAR